MEWLNAHIDAAIGILITLVIGYGFYKLSKRDKEPYWSVWTVNLFKDFSGSLEGLEVQYRGENVKDLSVSNVIFWNNGGLTLHKSDIADADPLRLEVQGSGRILSATILAENNQASLPQVMKPDKNRALISFDYLDRGQGFVIRVIHEGTGLGDLQVKGVLKGVLKRVEHTMTGFRPIRKWERLLVLVAVVVVAAILVFVGNDTWDTWSKGLIPSEKMDEAFIVWGLALFAATFPLGYLVTLFFGSRIVPRGLESFSTGPIQVNNRAKSNDDSKPLVGHQ